MRRTCDQHSGIGYDEATYLVRALVWINHRHRLVLIHSNHDVVAIDEAEGKLPTGHLIGAVAIARGQFDVILMQAVHECARAFITQKNKERCNLIARIVGQEE